MKRNGLLTATGVALALLRLAAAAYAGQQVPTTKRNPLVHVVTISQDGATKDESGSLLGAAMERLNQATAFQPDIACLPELFSRSAAESVPGATTARLSEWARQHACYVIAGILKL